MSDYLPQRRGDDVSLTLHQLQRIFLAFERPGVAVQGHIWLLCMYVVDLIEDYKRTGSLQAWPSMLTQIYMRTHHCGFYNEVHDRWYLTQAFYDAAMPLLAKAK